MKTIDISAATKPLAEYAQELDDQILVVFSEKKPIAAIVPLKDVDRESLGLSTSPEFMEIIEKAREEFQTGRKLTLEQIKREVLLEDRE